MKFLLYFTATICFAAAANAAPMQPCKVITKLPHLATSYTEGFFFRDGHFYEGTGLEGKSKILVYEPSGKITQSYDVPAQYFGEGIVDWGDDLYEWTWQTHVGFILDRTSLRVKSQFHYTGEGWGMTRTDKEIITSDGTAVLRFRSPSTFDQTHQLVVKDGVTPVHDLNELEFIPNASGGEILANVWHSDRIARISPTTGQVLAWIDCTGLLPLTQRTDAEAVLNGIAYDSDHKRLYITGKEWPTIFEIKLPPLSSR
jgi:glutaminyl-peptide cyclotransferase